MHWACHGKRSIRLTLHVFGVFPINVYVEYLVAMFVILFSYFQH